MQYTAAPVPDVPDYGCAGLCLFGRFCAEIMIKLEQSLKKQTVKPENSSVRLQVCEKLHFFISVSQKAPLCSAEQGEAAGSEG